MMDAMTYLRTVERVCGTYSQTGELCDVACPLTCGGHCIKHNTAYMNRALASLERWLAEHPTKTRKDEFLEHYPDAVVEDGALRICPKHVYNSAEINCNTTTCYLCMTKFWRQEVDA
mgnify:CR=1 FL=1